MLNSPSRLVFLGGRLALDFVNELGRFSDFSWDELLDFLLVAKIISAERSAQLLSLPDADPHSAGGLLVKARRLHAALRAGFTAALRGDVLSRAGVEAINDILRITEGHDELVSDGSKWHIEFVARENGLDWLLAAIARSGAEILVEAPSAPLRVCSNPACGLLFYDTSRTLRRRWCSMARCGNRHKVAAFSRRHAAGKSA